MDEYGNFETTEKKASNADGGVVGEGKWEKPSVGRLDEKGDGISKSGSSVQKYTGRGRESEYAMVEEKTRKSDKGKLGGYLFWGGSYISIFPPVLSSSTTAGRPVAVARDPTSRAN